MHILPKLSKRPNIWLALQYGTLIGALLVPVMVGLRPHTHSVDRVVPVGHASVTISLAKPIPTARPAKAALPAHRPAPVPSTQLPALHSGSIFSGTATWYSGATGAYGPLVGMYAAMRDCPQGGCRVRVSHAGHSVDVTVLDYGPAAWTGHLIDLCPAAFSRLAPMSAGVIDVTVSRLQG